MKKEDSYGFIVGRKYRLKSDEGVVDREFTYNGSGLSECGCIMTRPDLWELQPTVIVGDTVGKSIVISDSDSTGKGITIPSSESTGKGIRTFGTGANRNSDEGKLDFEGFLSPTVLKKYAEYMHKNRFLENGDVRDSDNWQKGIPIPAYMKSMYRHFFDTWSNYRGIDTPETQVQNLCGLLFNTMGMLHEILKEENKVK